VRGLLEQGVPYERLRLLGMEYREIADYLQGGKEYATMVEGLRHEIHLLAKRQETYFRGMEKRGVPVHWISKEFGLETILGRFGNG
jgi:tRNA dimethylallyltransferase